MVAIEVEGPSPEEMQERLIARLKQIIGDLEAEADRRVMLRHSIEKRWLEDLAQFNGRYDETTRAALVADPEASQLFINITRAKTNALVARLRDMLFPTDDRNWGLDPTPVPELTAEADQAVQRAREARQQAIEAPDDPMAQQAAEVAESASEAARHVMDEARRRCDAMALEIEDVLEQSRWPAECRDVIADGVKIGAGVVKAPVMGYAKRRAWRNEGGVYRLDQGDGMQPAVMRVDPWSFFPDPNARNLDEGQGTFERHLCNKQELRRLARLDGFDRDAIRRLVVAGAPKAAPSYLADLRLIGETDARSESDLWTVWEYTGPIDAEDLQDIYAARGDDEGLAEVAEVDPLDEVKVCLWFCQGEILKVAPYPLDSDEPIYSVFSLEKGESGILEGKGLPRIMRDEQSMLNAAVRMLIDNGRMAAGPQIVLDRRQVQPMDGRYSVRGFKMWNLTDEPGDGRPAFQQYIFDMAADRIIAIIRLAMEFIDQVTALPAMAQGEQGTGVTKTAQGMAILMSGTNITFRDIVRSIDDDVTTPVIRRLYDWHMQFSPKEHIKGDFEPVARGSGVLLVREMQQQTLVAMGDRYAGHPVFGPMLRDGGLPLLRSIFRSSMLPTDELILTDDEFAQAQMESAQQPDPLAEAEMKKAELAEAEMQVKVELANMEADMRIQVERMRQETAMMQMAEKLNMTMAQVDAQLQDHREEREKRERGLAAEIAMAQRTGKHSGGRI